MYSRQLYDLAESANRVHCTSFFLIHQNSHFTMTWEIVFVFVLLIFAITSFILERISADLTAITVFGILLFVSMLTQSTELPTLEDLLGVFGNSAPLTIAGMFVVSGALQRTGSIDLITSYLRKLVKLPYKRFSFYDKSCSFNVGVRYSATRNVSTAISIVATPVASTPLAQKLLTRSLTVM